MPATNNWIVTYSSAGVVAGSGSGQITGTPNVSAQVVDVAYTQVDVAGRIVRRLAGFTFHFTSPSPLGTAPNIFGGVQIWFDDSVSTRMLDSWPPTGTTAPTAGQVVRWSPKAGEVDWPTRQQSWTFYFVSISTTGVANTLVKSGANATPSYTFLADPLDSAPNVTVFQAGISNSDGTWAASMRWDPTQTELLIDYAAVMPVVMDSTDGTYVPAPNFGGIIVQILQPIHGVLPAGNPTSMLYISTESSPIGPENFKNENGDGVTFVYRHTISIIPDQVPQTPIAWDFVCQSYSTDAYPVGNHDINNLPIGPTITINTLAPVIPLTLQPAAAVTVGTITPSYIWPPGANIATQNPTNLQLNIPYTTPTGWIGVGVHVYVEYPDGSATAVFTLDSSRLDSTDGLGSASGVTDEGQFPATDRPDVSGAHHVIISNLPIPTGSTNIRVYCQGYTRDVDPVLVLANQTGATPSAVVPVTPPPVFALGQEYAANVTNFTATSYYQNDGNGHPKLWIQASWTPPTDPNFVGVKLALFRYNGWMPQGPYWSDLFTTQQGDWNAATGASTIGPRRSPVLGDLPRSAETTDIIYAVSFNKDGQYNAITPGVTPSEQIELDVPPMGTAGVEYTSAVVSNISVTMTITQTPEGIWQFNLASTFTAPNLTTYPEFNGCEIVLRNTSTSTNQPLGFTTPSATSFSKSNISIDTSQPTYDLYFVSCTKLNENTLVPGTTPRWQGLHPVPTNQSGFNLAYANPSSLGATLSGGGGSPVDVGNSAIAIQKFASTLRPVVFTTSDPGLPSSTYPAGTVECRVDLSPVVYKRVNAAGTAWEALVNTGDINASYVYAGAIAAVQVTAGNLVAGVVYAGPVTASQLTSGTVTALLNMTSPNISGGSLSGATLYINSGGTITRVANNSGYGASGAQTAGLVVQDSNTTVTISGGGGVGALAVVVVGTSGTVSALNLVSGGTGYTSTPTVTISGFGSGATASATISGGAVTSLSLLTAGTGYVVTQGIAFVPGGLQLIGNSSVTPSPAGIIYDNPGFHLAIDTIFCPSIFGSALKLSQILATSASAGSFSVPSTCAGFFTITDINGIARKVPCF